jgi:hypothetical protein
MTQDVMQGLKNFTRQYPQVAQKAKVEITKLFKEGGAPSPDEIKAILRLVVSLQKDPSGWAQVRPQLADLGMPMDQLPPPNATKEQLAQIIGVMLLTVYLIGQLNEPEGLINKGE